MRPITTRRQRVIVFIVLLTAASGTGWVMSSQASARGSAHDTSVGASPLPPRPNHRALPTVTPAATATNVHCGETVTASVTVNGDLYCPGLNGSAALTIRGASTTAVTLNLNGHTISSDRSGDCVDVISAGAIVEDGVITGCDTALFIEGSKQTATKLSANDNTFGLVDSGTGGSKITDDTVTNTTYQGIFEDGIGSTVSGNHAANNQVGLYVYRGTGLVASNNALDYNSEFGISIVQQGGTFTDNSANYNNGYGIYNTGNAIFDGGGNTAIGNDRAETPPQECVQITCS